MKHPLLLVFLLTIFSFSLKAQVKPDLKSVDPYTLLAGSGLVNSDNTEIIGKAGSYPGILLVGINQDMIPAGLEVGSLNAMTAQQDLMKAYIYLREQQATADLSAQPLEGRVLQPGVYTFDTDVVLDGTLTLDNNGNPEGVFIFQVEGDLQLKAESAILFSESAKPRIRNVFWQVKGDVTIGEASTFRGSILARGNISTQSSTQIHGRLLTTAGQITLNSTQISFPTDLSLTLTKSSGASQNGIYYINEQITFTLKAENLGPVSGSNVRVRSLLPAGISYVSATASTATFDPATSIWTIGNLASGGQETLQLTGRINERAVEILTHSASIAGSGMEEVLANNSDIITGICVAPADPGIIEGPTAMCSRSTDNVFSVAPIPGVMNYNWLVPAGWAITSGQNSPSITVRAGSSSGIITLIVGNVCASNTSQKTVAVSAARPLGPAAIMAPPTRPCAGQTGLTYSVSPVTGAGAYLWQVPADWTITAGQGTTTITVTAGEQAGSVSVAATNGCGPGPALALPVTAMPNQLPAPDKIIPSAPFCTNTTLELQVPAVPGATTYLWTLPAGWQLKSGAGTNKITVTVGPAAGEVSVTASNACVGAEAVRLPVSPYSLLAAGPLTGSPAPCAGESITYTVAAVPGARSYAWTLPAGWLITSGQTANQLTVTAGSTPGVVSVAAVNECGKGPAAQLAVAPIALPAAPGAIRASKPAPCAWDKELTYTIAPVAGASTYTWTVPNDWIITSGQGSTTITVTAGAEPGIIRLQAANSCGTSTAATMPVVPGLPLPATLGPVTGSAAVICQGQPNLTFRIAALPGGVTYDWQLPGGWEITAGAGTPSITATAGKMAGKITVTVRNSCGESLAGALDVDPLPLSPLAVGAITGNTVVCASQRGLVYALPPSAGASTYTWTLPLGWEITAGQGTEKITVTAGSQPGIISVVAANSCVQAPAATFLISKVNPAPPQAIKDLSSLCAGLVYTIGTPAELTPGSPDKSPSYSWKVPTGWTITAGQGSGQLSVVAPAGSEKGTISVVADNGNCTSAPITLEADPAVAEARINIANALTANGDGHNDTWEIAHLANYPDNEVILFNRWGNEVYRRKAYANDWNGGDLNAGTYFYQLKIRICDGTYKSYQGYVMLLRD